jgi:Right handed beta helix region
MQNSSTTESTENVDLTSDITGTDITGTQSSESTDSLYPEDTIASTDADTQGSESTDSLYPEDTSDSATDNATVEDTASQDDSADPIETSPVISTGGGNVIDVDGDYGGDLKSAIAAAGSGDTVRLGNNTYNASGITIDKDITVEGQGGSVVDGGGTSDNIFNLTSDASNATIQNVEITNGNNGIYSYGASGLTLQNLNIHNIGLSETIRDGQNNTAIILNKADGAKVLNSTISDVGRKGVGIGDTSGATVSGLTIENVNLAAEHAQNHDAGGIKPFNTSGVTISNNNLSRINGIGIWDDTTTGTTIENNTIPDVGADYLAPGFNTEVGDINGISTEKSYNSRVNNNSITAVDGHIAYDATESSIETLDLGENDFSNQQLGSKDYYADKDAEILVATTEDASAADFSTFSQAYYDTAITG